jgi:DNA-binding response OmpR family regulator
MIRIVVVEDNPVAREMLLASLHRTGHHATGVSDSTGLYRECLNGLPDIVVLDVDLPGTDGLAIARELRALSRTERIGIIMATSLGHIKDRIDGINSGADLYLTKPIDLDELEAYIQRIYRRIEPGAQPAATCWIYQKAKSQLVAPNGVVVSLSHTESAFIGILAQNAGGVVKRRDIIMLALKENPLSYDQRRLETMVSRLRKKLRVACLASAPIKVAHSLGYMFSDEITTM